MNHATPVGRRRDEAIDHREVIQAIEPAVARNLELLVPVDRA